MGSQITFSGFNSIDWTAVLEAVMTQESAPLTSLQKQQTTLKTQAASMRTLATKLSTFEDAVALLTDDKSLLGRTASSTNASSVSVSAGSSAAPGLYDVVVQELARAQVTASTSFAPDADTTIVASGGSFTIGGVPVTVAGPVTLRGLADQINATNGMGVTATVVKAGASAFQLVLTGRGTGKAGQFAVTNALTGGSGVTFGDADGNGVSGDSDADNSVLATDAKALVNNVQVVSSTNTLEDAISGVSLSLLKKDPTSTTTITVGEDVGTAKTRLKSVVTAFNDLVAFQDAQNTAAKNGDTTSVARDPLVRGLRNMLRNTLSAEYPAGGTSASSLAAVGLRFERTGKLSFSESAFDGAVASDFSDVRKLFTGDGTNTGAFVALRDAVQSYTKTDGLLKSADDRYTAQVSAFSSRIDNLTDRLANRRAALQKEYIAADMAMTQLKSASSSLTSLSGQYRLF